MMMGRLTDGCCISPVGMCDAEIDADCILLRENHILPLHVNWYASLRKSLWWESYSTVPYSTGTVPDRKAGRIE